METEGAAGSVATQNKKPGLSEILGAIGVLMGLLIFLATISYRFNGGEEGSNLIGAFGAFVAQSLLYATGGAAFLFGPYLLLMGLMGIYRGALEDPAPRLAALVAFTVALSTILSIASPGGNDGGVAGAMLGDFLGYLLGSTGAVITGLITIATAIIVSLRLPVPVLLERTLGPVRDWVKASMNTPENPPPMVEKKDLPDLSALDDLSGQKSQGGVTINIGSPLFGNAPDSGKPGVEADSGTQKQENRTDELGQAPETNTTEAKQSNTNVREESMQSRTSVEADSAKHSGKDNEKEVLPLYERRKDRNLPWMERKGSTETVSTNGIESGKLAEGENVQRKENEPAAGMSSNSGTLHKHKDINTLLNELSRAGTPGLGSMSGKKRAGTDFRMQYGEVYQSESEEQKLHRKGIYFQGQFNSDGSRFHFNRTNRVFVAGRSVSGVAQDTVRTYAKDGRSHNYGEEPLLKELDITILRRDDNLGSRFKERANLTARAGRAAPSLEEKYQPDSIRTETVQVERDFMTRSEEPLEDEVLPESVALASAVQEDVVDEEIYQDELQEIATGEMETEGYDEGDIAMDEDPALDEDLAMDEDSEPVQKAMPSTRVLYSEVPPFRLKKRYYLPPEILVLPDKQPLKDVEEEVGQTIHRLEKVMSDYGVSARVVATQRGPMITLYEIKLEPGTRVARIVGISDEIKMNLEAASLRIVAPIPGRSTIGIEIPNRIRDSVVQGEIVRLDPEFFGKSRDLSIVLGKDISGNNLYFDLARLPHLLIAGATGSGKSVYMNSVIASLLYNLSPEELRFIMIDPKMVELKLYEGIPHLLLPVITDVRQAGRALLWVVGEMERRYSILSRARSRDIRSYNERIAQGNLFDREGNESDGKMPYIVVLIDELADLMMVSAKEVEDSIIRLTQKARAVGIHVIMATQRPSVDVITALIKANCPARISFHVAQKTDSRTILDSNGAETLLGKGDMLYKSPTSTALMRLQAPLITELEIEKIVQETRRYGAPIYVDLPGEEEEQELEEGGDDDLFDTAWKIVLESGKTSTSYIQRRLRIGYNRAANLIELMEQRGYLSSALGNKPREILKRP